jgi:hypothetical protein
MRVFSDATTIRSYMLVGGFVDNYMIWTYYIEKAPPPRIHSMKSYKTLSFIDCLMLMMILMMLAAMKMWVEAMVMVSTGAHRWWQ